MSRTAILGSNALTTAVQFHAAALDEATRRADQAELLLKQAMKPPHLSYELEFIRKVVDSLSDAANDSLDKVRIIAEALDYYDARRREHASRSSTVDRNLVSADDAPRGGEVRDANVPR